MLTETITSAGICTVAEPTVRVRAALASNTVVSVVAQKTGSVEGTVNGLSLRRNYDWDDAGSSVILRDEWADVELSTFHVAKTYDDTGVLGGVQAVSTDILSFVLNDVALGPQAAVIMFLGNELTKITNTSTFGPGGVPGVLAVGGASYLIGPAYAIPLFVGTVVATNALVKSHPANSEEYAFLKLAAPADE
jgi:hypothetical protein